MIASVEYDPRKRSLLVEFPADLLAHRTVSRVPVSAQASMVALELVETYGVEILIKGYDAVMARALGE